MTTTTETTKTSTSRTTNSPIQKMTHTNGLFTRDTEAIKKGKLKKKILFCYIKSKIFIVLILNF